MGQVLSLVARRRGCHLGKGGVEGLGEVPCSPLPGPCQARQALLRRLLEETVLVPSRGRSHPSPLRCSRQSP